MLMHVAGGKVATSSTAVASARELIVYLTPTGVLEEQCRLVFERMVREVGATTAQTFPPHVSLTGFFHRVGERADAVIERLCGHLHPVSSPATHLIEVAGLRAYDDWVGLEIRSPWLEQLISDVVALPLTEGAEDQVRPKTGLHLTLSGGARTNGAPLDASHMVDATALASDVIDLDAVEAAGDPWAIALWERTSSGLWIRREHP